MSGNLNCGFLRWLVVAFCAVGLGVQAHAGPPAGGGQRWAVIVVGLPGDKEHEQLFTAATRAWQAWLVKELGFAPEHVLFLRGKEPKEGSRAATRQSLEECFEELSGKLSQADALWVFCLGHGNYDGRQAFLHVPGPDADAAALAGWLDRVACGEQVVFLTHSCSGWFLKPLSRPGRVVIAATAAELEENETEFPHALATVVARPAGDLDAGGDGKVSLVELFAATVTQVEARFKADKRLPTEHAQLDDNGDGQGTEAAFLAPGEASSPVEAAETPLPKSDPKGRDGAVAAALILPYTGVQKDQETPKPE